MEPNFLARLPNFAFTWRNWLAVLKPPQSMNCQFATENYNIWGAGPSTRTHNRALIVRRTVRAQTVLWIPGCKSSDRTSRDDPINCSCRTDREAESASVDVKHVAMFSPFCRWKTWATSLWFACDNMCLKIVTSENCFIVKIFIPTIRFVFEGKYFEIRIRCNLSL